MPDLGQVVTQHKSNDLLKGVTEAVGVKGRWNLLSEELLVQRQERVVRRAVADEHAFEASVLLNEVSANSL